LTGIPPAGTGPGALTRDGCAVEVYRLLPLAAEVELVRAVAAPGSAILDLGCGTGRIADPLARAGHRVVAVDESAQMLDRIRCAQPVQARIEGLDLGREFDLVLLASFLANSPDAGTRHELFRACRRHVRPDGVVLLQWHPPGWFDALAAGPPITGALGPVAVRLQVHSLDRHRLDATVEYRAGADRWTQRFSAARLSQPRLVAELARAGLGEVAAVDENRSWLTCRPVTSRPGPEPAAGD